jgi:hypothetical protein
MATTAQIAANQVNSQSSTGPRSEAGKQTVSRNAVAHGLTAKKFFLSDDDKPAFAELRAALAQHYNPGTDHERNLLEELAEAKWRSRTARTMEASFFEMVVEEQRKADPTLSEEHALARLFLDDTLQKRMRLMMRYITAAERSAEKARRELESVIALRQDAEAQLALLRSENRAAGSRLVWDPEPAPSNTSSAPQPAVAAPVCSINAVRKSGAR